MGHRSKAIRAEGLEKRFGKTQALAGLDLSAEEGTVLGILGPNGAGKTTTVRILSTLVRPDAGLAEVAGFDVVRDPDQVRCRIGLTGQYAAIDELLTGRENLELIGQLSHLGGKVRARASALLERFDLTGAASRLAGTYSGGMRRRLDIAASLVATPSILFLDEPTTGLDPRSRLGMWELIRELVADGTTVLLTTQYLDEADQLADRIAVIDGGRVIAEGTAPELKAQLGGLRIDLSLDSDSDLQAAVASIELVVGSTADVDPDARQLSVPAAAGGSDMLSIIRALDRAGSRPTSLAIRQPSLDDVFLALTGKSKSASDKQEVA